MKIRLNAQVTNGVGKVGERKVYGPGEDEVPDGLAKQLLNRHVAVEVKKVAAPAAGDEATGDE